MKHPADVSVAPLPSAISISSLLRKIHIQRITPAHFVETLVLEKINIYKILRASPKVIQETVQYSVSVPLPGKLAEAIIVKLNNHEGRALL